MRASRYMLFLYAAMIGTPVLLYIRIFSLAGGMLLLSTILLALAAIGLVVFGILGYMEIYSGRRPEKMPLDIPVHYAPARHERRFEGEGRSVTLRVARFDTESRMMKEKEYGVRADRLTTVLGALLAIKENDDPTLAMRYSCRMGICGSCGMVINGKPALACETNVFDSISNGKIMVEPMYGHPLTRDLVTDFDDFFEKHVSVNPGLYRKNGAEKYAAKKPYDQSKKEIDKFLPYSYCIMCGLCLDACPVVNANPNFVGPQALSQAYRYHADSRDQMGDKRLFDIDTVDGVWGCEFAGACSKVCPKGVDPAAAIQLLKGELFKKVATDEKEG